MSNEFYDEDYTKSASIEIILEDTFHQDTILTTSSGTKKEFQTFYSTDPIKGSIQITLNNNSNKVHHSGIKIELIGEIDIHINNEESNNINNNQFNRFLYLSKNLSSQGYLNNKINNFDFEFKAMEKPYDSYVGKIFSIKYFLLVTIDMGFSLIKKEKEICVFNCDKNLKKINELFTNDNNKIKVEIGVENLLHVCFELDRKNYHLKDVISGKVTFKKINLELENMSLKLLKIESLFGQQDDAESLGFYEIMEGTPSSTDDVIYFKMYLKAFNNLSQSIKNEMNNNINVSYYLNLEICDTENRNFFKKIEINLFRLPEEYYNKMRQNILEGKKNNLFSISNININEQKNSYKNNKKDKIKNLFSNMKNPLEDDININNDNSDKDNDEEDDKDKKEENNINNISNDKNKEDSDEIKKNKRKKKISSLFNSD